MIKRIVKLTIRTENISAFLTLFEEIKNKIRNFPGCRHLELWDDVNDKNTFFTYSLWDDEEALNRYRNSELFSYVWPALKAFFSDKAQVWSVEVASVASGDALAYGEIGKNLDIFLRGSVYSSLFLICDENTGRYCLPFVQSYLQGYKTDLMTLPAGEIFKQPHTCVEIWKKMYESGVDRKGLVINIGGGVVTDIGGFAASTYMRGVDFINIPTTLLAMIDASVGGKTGVDLESWKNGVGVFRNPSKVLIDPRFLATLPQKHLRAGYAEALKHGVLDSEHLFFESVRALESAELPDAGWIRNVIAVKEKIVNIDPHERNVRKFLNFGHTVGHALESFYLDRGEELLHGEAVAWGMLIEAGIALQSGLLDQSTHAAVTGAIEGNYSFPRFEKKNTDRLLEWMCSDKKSEAGQIGFSLPVTFGVMKNVLLDRADIEKYLNSVF